VSGDGDRDNRAAFATLEVEPAPEVVQPLLGLPGDRDEERILTLLSALERGPESWWPTGRGTTSARCPCGSFSDAALPNPA